jgi:hypothetical protein
MQGFKSGIAKGRQQKAGGMHIDESCFQYESESQESPGQLLYQRPVTRFWMRIETSTRSNHLDRWETLTPNQGVPRFGSLVTARC